MCGLAKMFAGGLVQVNARPTLCRPSPMMRTSQTLSLSQGSLMYQAESTQGNLGFLWLVHHSRSWHFRRRCGERRLSDLCLSVQDVPNTRWCIADLRGHNAGRAEIRCSVGDTVAFACDSDHKQHVLMWGKKKPLPLQMTYQSTAVDRYSKPKHAGAPYVSPR